MNIKNWKLLETTTAFKKYVTHIERRDYELPSGEVADFYIKTGPPGVCILALTSENQVIVARQYRPGPGKILNELPGGFVDAGEDPVEAAARELTEETGFTGKVELVSQYFEDAYTDRLRYGCVATHCQKVDTQHLGRREFAEVALLSLDEFIALARSGQMTDTASAMLGLDYLGLLSARKK